MRDLKDMMIEEAQERRERNENVLDEIESFGERFEWLTISRKAERRSLHMGTVYPRTAMSHSA